MQCHFFSKKWIPLLLGSMVVARGSTLDPGWVTRFPFQPFVLLSPGSCSAWCILAQSKNWLHFYVHLQWYILITAAFFRQFFKCSKKGSQKNYDYDRESDIDELEADQENEVSLSDIVNKIIEEEKTKLGPLSYVITLSYLLALHK